MQTKFKKHQKVRLVRNPDLEYVEYSPDREGEKIEAGMLGEINVILPNGQYHVEVFDSEGEKIAYVMIDEDMIEGVD
jgi:hypothetical protein